MYDFCVFLVRFPWDQTTITGYIAATIIKFIAYLYRAYALTSVYYTFVGFCEVSIAFAIDLELNIGNINEYIANEENPNSPASQAQLETMICDFIQFHGDAKQ